jgi:hypothetical protein
LGEGRGSVLNYGAVGEAGAGAGVGGEAAPVAGVGAEVEKEQQTEEQKYKPQ